MTSGSPVPAIVFLGEVQERTDNCGVVGYELLVEVGKAKEGVHILDFGWGRSGGNTIKFDRVHDKLTRFHDHSKVFDFRDIELALLELQVKVKFCHSLEDMTGSLCMGFWVGGGNKEVVYVDDEPSFSNHVSEGVIHESLEHGGGVTETKEHDGGFEGSLMGDKGHLPLVTILDMDIVVSLTNVELGKMMSVLQFVY